MKYQRFTLTALSQIFILVLVVGHKSTVDEDLQILGENLHLSLLSKYEVHNPSLQAPIAKKNYQPQSITQRRLVRSVDDDNAEASGETTTQRSDSTIGRSTTENPVTGDDECATLRHSKIGVELSDIKSTNKFLRCLLLALEALQVKNTKSENEEPKKLKSIENGDIYLPDDYNKYEVPVLNLTIKAPNGTDIKVEGPAEANILLNIRGIRGIDEVEEEMTLDMDVAVIWTDGQILKRVKTISDLSFTGARAIILNPVFLKKIWTPDIYFEDAASISTPTFMGKAENVVLYPTNGFFVYRTRIIAKLSCEMNFAYYPADTQECTYTLKSFSNPIKTLTVNWVKSEGPAGPVGGIYLLETSDPNFDYQVASYTVEDLPIDLGPHTTPEALYSTLKFTIMSRRKLSYHIVQTYIPSSFFVIVTWLCFLIPSDMFEARVGISMTTLLTLTAMFASVRETSPTVSYVKAIDIWMVVCIIFLFCALTAFTASEWVKRVLRKFKQRESVEENGNGLEEELKDRNIGNVNTKYLWMYEKADGFIETYLAWILSAGFVIFVIVYWLWLLFESGYSDWEVNPTLNRME